MKNTVYYLKDKEHFITKTYELPTLKSQYVRVKNLYCGICGSDYSAYLGRRAKYNISLGHEFVSKVIGVGEDVHGFKLDDIVVSDFNYRCGQCRYCSTGHSHLCEKNDIELFDNRAFADYSDIQYSYLIPINSIHDNLISATCIEPLSCVIHAVNRAAINSNDKVLIVGNGNIGTLAAFYLRIILHVDDVYVIDKIDQKSDQLVHFFDCKLYTENIIPDIILEATNEMDGLMYAISKSIRGGRISSMSHLYGVDTSLAYNEIIKNEIDIKYPLRNGDKENIINASQYIAQYWEKEFNSMFELSNLADINGTFGNKIKSSYNRQIILIV